MGRRSPEPRRRPAFAQMWRAAQRWCDEEEIEMVSDACKLALQKLPRSRTVVVDPAQALAMRELHGPELACLRDVRAPFEYMLLDLAVQDGQHRFIHGVLIEDDGEELTGLVCETIHGHDIVVPMPDMRRADIEDEIVDAFGRIDDRLAERGEKSAYTVRDALRLPSIVYGIFAMLESVNVELVESPYPAGQRGAGTPRFEVAIRQSTRRYRRREETDEVEWSHRWEVRQRFLHHQEHTPEGRENKIFAAALRDQPEKIVEVDGVRCVRVFQPAHVKGPEHLPLIPKVRTMHAGA